MSTISSAIISTQKIEVDKMMSEVTLTHLEALQILLIFDKKHKAFDLATKILVNGSQAKKLDLQQQYLLYLQSVTGKNIHDKTPLDFEKVKNLPNLLQTPINTAKFSELLRVLEEMAEKNILSSMVLSFFQKKLLEDEIDPYIKFAVINMLLKNYYGRNGDKLVKDNRFQQKMKIRNFLSVPESYRILNTSIDNEENTNTFSSDLLLPLAMLKFYLYHTDRTLRLKARSICEDLKIPLALSKMLPLSIDGVTTDNNEYVNDLVLVIGGTGAGKSTLINYLSGIEYVQKKDPLTGTRYLEPKGNKIPPAKVGHGATSQTLYPQIVRNKDFSFADVAGFDDTRDKDQVICATLSVPFATHYAKNIRAILIVLEYEITKVNASNRGANLRMLCQTLSEIIQEEYYLDGKGKIPFIFAITKPPIPDYSSSEFFDPDQQSDYVISSLQKILEEKHNAQDDVEKLTAELDKIDQTITDLDLCIKTLDEFLKGQSNLDSKWGFSNIIALISTTVKEGKKAHVIKEKCDELARNGMPIGSVQRLSVFFNILIDIKTDAEKDRALKDQKQIFTKERSDHQKRFDEFSKELQEKRGERSILQLMINNSENICIIRGYKSNNSEDLEDHREKLIKKLEELRSNNSEISSQHLQFNPNAELFSKAREWSLDSVAKMIPLFANIKKVQEKILDLDTKITEVQLNLDNDKNMLLDYCLKSKESKPSESIKSSLDRSIKRFTEQKKAYEELIAGINNEILALRNKNNEILSNRELVEYGSRLLSYQETPSFFTKIRMMFKIGQWSFEFPGRWNNSQSIFSFISSIFGYAEDIIPISRIEISCSVDDKGMLIFSSPIKKGIVEEGDNFSKVAIQLNNNIYKEHQLAKDIFQITTPKTIPSGIITLDNANDLTKGIFKLSYAPRDTTKKYIGVRTFVLAKFIPRNVRQMDQNNESIEWRKRENQENTVQLVNVNKQLESMKEALRMLTQGGLALNRQQYILKKINEYIYLLSYTKESFVKEFFSELDKDDLTRLADKKCVERLSKFTECNEKQFQKFLNFQKMNSEGFSAILGVEPKEHPFILDDYLEPAFEKTPKLYVQKLYKIVMRTGITISTLHELLKWNITADETNKPWVTQLEKLRAKRDAYQLCYQFLWGSYRENLSLIQSLDAIINILKFEDNEQLKTFSEYSKKQARDIERHEIGNKSLLELEIESNYREYANFGIDKMITISSLKSPVDVFLYNISHKKEKSFELLQKPALIGRMPFHQSVSYFDEFQYKSDNALIWEHFGLKEDFKSLLLSFSPYEQYRKEIAIHICNYYGARKVSIASSNEAIKLYRNYIACQAQTSLLEASAKKMLKEQGVSTNNMSIIDLMILLKEESMYSKNLLDIYSKLENSVMLENKCEQEIEQWICSEDVFKDYIASLGANAGIPYKLLKLMSIKKDFNFCLWKRSANVTRLLDLKDFHYRPNNRTMVHVLLNRGGTHYNLLIETDKQTSKDKFEMEITTSTLFTRNLQDEMIANAFGSLSPKSNGLSYFVQETEGKGDCAFHASFGKEVNGVIVCQEVNQKRKMVADAIRKANKESALFPHIVSAIQAMLMNGDKSFAELRKVFREHSINNQKLIQIAWGSFETELKNHQEILEYINQQTTTKPNLNTIYDKFQYCLNLQGGVLLGLIWSVPNLKKKYDEFNTVTHQGFDLASRILIDRSILEEYAKYIETPGQWLLPQELMLLAIVFNISIQFYTYNPYKQILSSPEIYNPGYPVVGVCFNGFGHFEMVRTEQLNKSVSALPVIFSAKSQLKGDAPTPKSVNDAKASYSHSH